MSFELTYVDLLEEVSEFMGFGRDIEGLDTNEIKLCESIIKSGLRQFYYPASNHDWTFLKPTFTLATVADSWEYPLPKDFGSLEGTLHFSAGSGVGFSIEQRSEGVIDESRQRSLQSGRPHIAAVKVEKGSDGGYQKSILVFYPTPDAAYEVRGRYRARPVVPSVSNPYLPGGTEVSEAILSSCLSVAERRMTDNPGVQAANFQQALQAAIAQDIRKSPSKLGYNGNGQSWGGGDRVDGYVTYNNTIYGDV